MENTIGYILCCQSPALFLLAIALLIRFFVRKGKARVRAIVSLIAALACIAAGVVLYYQGLLLEYFTKELDELNEENVQIRILGDIDGMPAELDKQKSALHAAIERTKGNTGLKLCIALNYGGRQEIVRAARILAQQTAQGLISPEEIDMPRFESQLYTAGLPEVDFLIRTSGEIRLSNCRLYQLAYAEF